MDHELAELRGYLLGTDKTSGFCQRMEDSLIALSESVGNINDKQDAELKALEAMIRDVQNRQTLMEERLRIIEAYHHQRQERGFQWKHAIVIGVLLAAVEIGLTILAGV